MKSKRYFFFFLFTNKAPHFCERKYMRQWLKLGCIEHSHGAREAFAHEELKMSRIQPSCELHLGGSERDRDGHREGLRQAGAKPWRGAFWHNDSHLPLTGLGKVKLIMTAHRCWIALDEVNHWQSNKQVLNDFGYLPWNYRMFTFFSNAALKATIYPKYAVSFPRSNFHERLWIWTPPVTKNGKLLL